MVTKILTWHRRVFKWIQVVTSSPKCLAVLVAIVFVSGHLTAQAGTTVQQSFFGIHVNRNSSPWPNTQGFSFGGWSSLSSSVLWSDINTSNGVYDFSRLDQFIQKARAAGQDVLYTAYYTPAWASSDPTGYCTKGNLAAGGCYPPNDLNSDGTGTDQHWTNFITALFQHEGVGGIKYLEIWNEPYVSGEWKGTNAQMVRMAKDARSAAHAIDPNVQIVSPPAGSTSLNGFLSAGGSAYVDVLGFHGYANSPEDDVSRISGIQTTAAQYGLSSKPLFDTEGSWGVANTSAFSDTHKVQWLGRQYLVQLGRVQRFYWFGWDLDGGLWKDATNSPTKAGTAYQQLYSCVIGRSFTPCSQSGTVWTCVVTGSNNFQGMAVWNTAGSSTYSAATKYVKYLDLYGGSYSIPSTHQVTIGSSPIFLEN